MLFQRGEYPRRTWSKEVLISPETTSSFLFSFCLIFIFLFLCFRESCGEGSVKVLEERLEEMGFQYSCINDYV